MNTVFGEYGLPLHPTPAYRMMVGSGLVVLIRRALGLGDDEPSAREAAMAARVRELFRADPIGDTAPYPGIEDLLARLDGRDVPMAVLSNKPDELTTRIVDGLLGRFRFASVMGLRDGAAPKPDPASALESARLLGVTPAEVLLLGDSDIDMRTAVNAGMFPVGVTWGFRKVDDLVKAGAMRIVEHPREVYDLIDSAVEVSG